MTVTKPFCFVLMPFGRRQIAGGATIDFDAVYQQIIQPVVSKVGLELIRADEARNDRRLFGGGGVCARPRRTFATTMSGLGPRRSTIGSARPWSLLVRSWATIC